MTSYRNDTQRISTCAWDDDPVVAGWSGLPVLETNTTADVCVVGLGGSGLAAVSLLVERGLRVVGIDAGRVAAGAGGRNGGFLLGGPATFLHSALETWGPSSVDLYRATLFELDRLTEMLGPEVISRNGSIRLVGLPGDPIDDIEADDRAAEEADCQALKSALDDHRIPVQTYDGELGHGLFLPDDAAMNPSRRALGMASLFRKRAGIYEHSPASSIETGRVTTEFGSVSAPVIIVAIDGKLEQILPELRGRVRTARLQMLATTAGLPRRLPCPVYGRWGYDYAQQTPDGQLLVGGGRDHFADDEWTSEDSPTLEVQNYIETVAQRMAGQHIDVTRRWGASVGYTADGRPICSEIRSGVFAIGGYNGTGNLVGPVAARAAVALALDSASPPAYFTP